MIIVFVLLSIGVFSYFVANKWIIFGRDIQLSPSDYDRWYGKDPKFLCDITGAESPGGTWRTSHLCLSENDPVSEGYSENLCQQTKKQRSSEEVGEYKCCKQRGGECSPGEKSPGGKICNSKCKERVCEEGETRGDYKCDICIDGEWEGNKNPELAEEAKKCMDKATEDHFKEIKDKSKELEKAMKTYGFFMSKIGEVVPKKYKHLMPIVEKANKDISDTIQRQIDSDVARSSEFLKQKEKADGFFARVGNGLAKGTKFLGDAADSAGGTISKDIASGGAKLLTEAGAGSFVKDQGMKMFTENLNEIAKLHKDISDLKQNACEKIASNCKDVGNVPKDCLERYCNSITDSSAQSTKSPESPEPSEPFIPPNSPAPSEPPAPSSPPTITGNIIREIVDDREVIIYGIDEEGNIEPHFTRGNIAINLPDNENEDISVDYTDYNLYENRDAIFSLKNSFLMTNWQSVEMVIGYQDEGGLPIFIIGISDLLPPIELTLEAEWKNALKYNELPVYIAVPNNQFASAFDHISNLFIEELKTYGQNTTFSYEISENDFIMFWGNNGGVGSSKIDKIDTKRADSNADSNNDGVVSLTELTSHIQKWINGGVSLNGLTEAIQKWING